MADSEEKLKTLLEETAKEHEYNNCRIDIGAITSRGANYTANLYMTTISEPPKPDINIFAKVASLSEEIREKNEVMAKIYLIESIFYTEVVTHFEKLYEENGVPVESRLVIPKYYGHVLTKNEETLLLENLEANGYQHFDRRTTFDWEYAAAAVQEMARLHALGLAFREENPTEFDRIMGLFEAELFEDGMMDYFMTEIVKNSCEAVSEEYGQRLKNFYSSKEKVEHIIMTSPYYSDKTMMIHGDFRPSNLMHRRINGTLQIILLDYQTVRLSTPVSDLMYFIFSGSDGEFRRLHYEHLLEHYYTELNNALQELHIDVENVYSKKTYQQDVTEMLPFGLALGLSLAAVITVAPEDAPKLQAAMTDILIKPNDMAKQRIAELVSDFVRWGIL